MNNCSLYTLLSKYGDYQQKTAGEDIFSYGDSAAKVYLIIKGLIRVFIQDQHKKEKEVARLSSEDILGELALLGAKEYSSRATAYEDSILIEFSSENFRQLLSKQTILNEKIITSLCSKIDLLQRPIIEFTDLISSSKEESNSQDTTDEKIVKEEIDSFSNFYLDGHCKYLEVAGEDFEYYLYDKSVNCPICSTRIEVKEIRNSRLRLKETRDDLRPIYKHFRPDWYKIWICPKCFYTASKDDFFDLTTSRKRKIKEEFKAKVQSILGDNYQPTYSNPRKLNEVFDAYYLAIESYNLMGSSKEKFAYLWLKLSWLYEDVDEEELAKKASFKAMENLREFYFKEHHSKLSNSKNNKITLLLSFLFYKHGLKDEALPLLDTLIRNHQIKRSYKEMARDKFIEIREEKRRAKEENQV
ncbi:hypothetical protein BX659_10953 [Orenia metallireducens]|uniref:Cyclic nucleotide-binding domain-containing protein n=1 Tax=Orenia metallireducens TaxID=1413210 RepID=A0A285H2V2_9FIRM|nr:DUF2225 domain-containing protein [Orenia metallireducens]PRX29469.1 hypothetical protein BX659_10953 [Orenia metallireducens]SNY30055.1 hypothetical protein SAMN06265827_11353 [Orenia metallireducens]